MIDFSLICSVENVTARGLKEVLESLQEQTGGVTYEVILLAKTGRAKDQAVIQSLLPAYPNAKMKLRPNQAPISTTINGFLDQLQGAWVGMIGYRDRLLPHTLRAAMTAIAEHPAAKVVFTDEECRDALNRITHRFDKLGFNPYRLLSQEYLQDLALIERAWLQQLGGFDPLINNYPTHDLFLRTYTFLGAEGFAHIPERLYQRFRTYRANPSEQRKQLHIPGADTNAIRRHLNRHNIAGSVESRSGSTRIQYTLGYTPWTTVFLVVKGSLSDAWNDVELSSRSMGYNVARLRLVYTGDDLHTFETLKQRCQHLGVLVYHVPGDLVSWFNQRLPQEDVSVIGILQGTPVSSRWLAEGLSHLQLPNVGVVGGRCITPLQLTMPGVLNYRYEGWDWNSRGKFNLLVAPHNVSAVSAHSMLFRLEDFLSVQGFAEDLPTLYGMEFCMTMQRDTGKQILYVPTITTEVSLVHTPDEEAALFKGRWNNWSDRYSMITAW